MSVCPPLRFPPLCALAPNYVKRLGCIAAYDRKKYVWKLLYIYMLGYEIDFGHKQACDLCAAEKCDPNLRCRLSFACGVRGWRRQLHYLLVIGLESLFALDLL